MSDATVPTRRHRRATPWPVLAALGLALSELGVFVGLFAVAVVGLSLFGASVAGLLTETYHAARPWLPMAALGAILAGAGLAVVLSHGVGDRTAIRAFGADPVLSRALSVVAGGAVLTVAGAVAAVAERV